MKKLYYVLFVALQILLNPMVFSEQLATEDVMASASPADMEASIKKAIAYLDGKQSSGGPQYSDYVVFCGSSVFDVYPENNNIFENYKTWISKNDRSDDDFIKKLPYQSICHVMALDIIGEHDKAVGIFSKLKPIANDGQWEIPYHIGWYLYGCIVADDKELLDKTFAKLSEIAETHPDKFQYFSAYCLWKAYEKTKDDKYRQAFLMLAGNLKQFQGVYAQMAATDGHAGMTLSVFCRAYHLTKDEEYRKIARKMAGILLSSQTESGSWNDKTAYTIMSAEGLTSYLQMCR